MKLIKRSPGTDGQTQQKQTLFPMLLFLPMVMLLVASLSLVSGIFLTMGVRIATAPATEAQVTYGMLLGADHMQTIEHDDILSMLECFDDIALERGKLSPHLTRRNRMESRERCYVESAHDFCVSNLMVKFMSYEIPALNISVQVDCNLCSGDTYDDAEALMSVCMPISKDITSCDKVQPPEFCFSMVYGPDITDAVNTSDYRASGNSFNLKVVLNFREFEDVLMQWDDLGPDDHIGFYLIGDGLPKTDGKVIGFAMNPNHDCYGEVLTSELDVVSNAEVLICQNKWYSFVQYRLPLFTYSWDDSPPQDTYMYFVGAVPMDNPFLTRELMSILAGVLILMGMILMPLFTWIVVKDALKVIALGSQILSNINNGISAVPDKPSFLIRDSAEIYSVLEQAATTLWATQKKHMDRPLPVVQQGLNIFLSSIQEMHHTFYSTTVLIELLQLSALNTGQRDLVNMVDVSSNLVLLLLNKDIDHLIYQLGTPLSLDIQSLDIENEVLVIVDIMAITTANKNVDLAIFFSDTIPQRIRGDGGRIRQIIYNLLSNSLNSLPSTLSFVTISVDFSSNGSLKITIQDTGCGVARHAIPVLFKRPSKQLGCTPPHESTENSSGHESTYSNSFGNTQSPRQSVGLSVVMANLEALEGDLHVESSTDRLNHGTKLTVTIPAEVIEPSGMDYASSFTADDTVIVVSNDTSLPQKHVQILSGCQQRSEVFGNVAVVLHYLAKWGIDTTVLGDIKKACYLATGLILSDSSKIGNVCLIDFDSFVTRAEATSSQGSGDSRAGRYLVEVELPCQYDCTVDVEVCNDIEELAQYCRVILMTRLSKAGEKSMTGLSKLLSQGTVELLPSPTRRDMLNKLLQNQGPTDVDFGDDEDDGDDEDC